MLNNSKETVSSGHSRTDLHMDSETGATHTRPGQVQVRKKKKIPVCKKEKVSTKCHL